MIRASSCATETPVQRSCRHDLDTELDEYTERLASNPLATAARLRSQFPGRQIEIDRLVEAAATPHTPVFPDATPPINPIVSRPPARLSGYRLAKRIGSGGMGDVYFATHPSQPGHRFAAKVLRSDLWQARFLRRFESECQLAATPVHRNIVQVVDSGWETESDPQRQSRRFPYLIMRWIDGTDLASHCHQNQLSLHDRLRLFLQVCRGVACIHRHRILHRDLKPTNILVAIDRGKPVAKIIDFGLACALTDRLGHVSATDSSLRTRQVLGTLPYMSPERATLSPSEVDVRSDVFSLGVILFQLLTGDVPLAGELCADDPIESQLSVIRDQNPIRPSERTANTWRSCTEVRNKIDAVTVKALASNPQDRMRSANKLAQRVHQLLDLIQPTKYRWE